MMQARLSYPLSSDPTSSHIILICQQDSISLYANRKYLYILICQQDFSQSRNNFGAIIIQEMHLLTLLFFKDNPKVATSGRMKKRRKLCGPLPSQLMAHPGARAGYLLLPASP